MPKKVCVMCFFLPQVHRHKAQAQFPSFNRVARISLSFVKNVPVQETSRVTTAGDQAADIGHLRHMFCVTEKSYGKMLSCLYHCLHCQSGREMMLFGQEETWMEFMQEKRNIDSEIIQFKIKYSSKGRNR